MAETTRLNGVIAALESGKPAFVTFSPPTPENAQAIGDAAYDGVVFEMEHGAYDIRALRDSLQYMLNRKQIVERGSLAPAVTPLVRIPPNGGEMNQWIAKQVLDSGVYGIVWPHVSTVEEARNAMVACRYPRPKDAPLYEPAGQRGDAPAAAARYWGLSQQEYYKKADVWPLAPDGEVVVAIMCEELRAVDNLPDILEQVPGITAVIIGEGDLSQDLGYPRQYEHPKVVAAMNRVVETCQKFNVVCGHPHVDTKNVEWILEKGYRWLMPSPSRSFPALEMGRKLAGR
ncbi:MAG: aldolase/citrate lyase family protein [Chloroflexota bacterium]